MVEEAPSPSPDPSSKSPGDIIERRKAAVQRATNALKGREKPAPVEAAPPPADAPAPPPDPEDGTSAPAATEPAPPEETEGQKLISRAWAALATREKKMREEVDQSRQAVESAKATRAEADKILAELRADPIAFVTKQVGPSWYETATGRMLNGGEPTEAERLKAIEAQASNIDKVVEQRVQEALSRYEQQISIQREVSQIRSEISTVLQDDRFELTRLFPNGAAEVEQVIAGYLTQHGRRLTAEQAAGMVEKVLEENLGKAKKFAPKAPVEPESKKSTSGPSAERPRTIGQKLTSGAATPKAPMTRAERIAAATKAMRRIRQA